MSTEQPEWTLDDSREGYKATLRLIQHLGRQIDFLQARLDAIEKPGGPLDITKRKDATA